MNNYFVKHKIAYANMCIFEKKHINAHFLSNPGVFPYAIFFLNIFFFHAIKKNRPSSPKIRSFFFRKLREKIKSCWCLGYGF